MRAVLILLLLPFIASCGYLFGREGLFPDKSQNYKSAEEVPPLRLPEGEDESALGEIYPIPPITDTILLAGEFEVPRPVPLLSNVADEQVRIQSLGDDSWALVTTAPGQLWPQIRAFLSVSQIPVAREDARSGLIESGWVALEGEPMESRFRYRLDQGVQRGTSELHVLQMSRAGDVDNWPASSSDPAQENEMLRAISQFIANSADSTPVSMIADQAISAVGKISIQEGPNEDTYILLTLPYDRAWASVGRGIEESNFAITDRDRSAGNYYVTFLGVNADEESGWFDWLGGSDDDDPMADQSFIISLQSLDENDVAIRIEQEPADEDVEFRAMEQRDEQGLLSLLKSNID
ncbi:MAG: outer membrane protein assembly factor BamC [Pseudomonadota bacterium]